MAEKTGDESRLAEIKVDPALLAAHRRSSQDRTRIWGSLSRDCSSACRCGRSGNSPNSDSRACCATSVKNGTRANLRDSICPFRCERRSIVVAERWRNAQQNVQQRQLRRDQESKQLDEAIGRKDAGESCRTISEGLPRRWIPMGFEGWNLGRQSYENARTDLPGIEKQCETRLGHLHDTLRNIGPNWTEERLVAFDTSLAVQEDISAHQRRLSECRSERAEAARCLGGRQSMPTTPS